MTQTVTVTQASIADLIEQRDELLEALKDALSSFRCTQRPERYPEDHWCNRAIVAIAKASPIAGLTEIGGCDE